MQALLAWVGRVTPPGQSPTVGRLLALAEDEELSARVRGLERILYREGDSGGWTGDALARDLERVRGAHRELRRAAAPPLLAPLNPTS